MTVRLGMAILGLAIGVAFGGGVEKAKKLVNKSKRGEVETMKVLELVTDDLKEEGVDKVIGWVIDNGFAEERRRVGEVIWSIPENDQLILKYVRVLGFFGEREQLEATIAKLAMGKLHQEARFRLALLLAEDVEKNLTLTDNERAATNQEVVLLLEKLGKEEGLPKILQKWISDLSFKVSNLVVGCEAPEIEGLDDKGEKFRLSEYRGKVVLLPFWGFW